MKKENVRGVALVKEVCPVCGQSFDAEIIINTLLTASMAKKVEELNGKNIRSMKEPCDECKGYMKLGIIVVSYDAEKTGTDFHNPYRTGGFFVITEEAAVKLEFSDEILKRRVCFMEHEVAVKLGFFQPIKN